MDILYIVVPCYNEEEVLPETAKRLEAKLSDLIKANAVAKGSRIMFVDDGSRDRTWELITALHETNPLYSGVKLSRNRGHQNALLAGLFTAMDRADMVISMDADLQDDISAVDEMVKEYNRGCDIVYGVRASRAKDSAFKRFTAESFYRVISMLGGELVFNHADYRLLSRRALKALAGYGEVNLFLRGVVPMLGFKTAVVEYERGERYAGESKYPLKKMLSFAIEGVTSLSSKPLRAIMWLGALSVLAAFIMLAAFMVGGSGDFGWKSVLFAVTLFSGLIQISLGIVGEYVGKIYLETKKRPRYFIESILSKEKLP